jgi:hypothetical protein
LVQQPTQDSDTSDDKIGTEPVQFTDEPPVKVQRHVNTESSKTEQVKPHRKSSGSFPLFEPVKDTSRDTAPVNIVTESEKQSTGINIRRKSSGSGSAFEKQKDETSVSPKQKQMEQVEMEQAFDDVFDDLQFEAEAIRSDKTDSITSNQLPLLSDNQNEDSQTLDTVAKGSVAMESVSLDTVVMETNSMADVDQEVCTQQTLTDRMSEVEAPGVEVDGQKLKQDDDESVSSKRDVGENDQKKGSAGEDGGKKDKKHKHKHRYHHKDGEDGEERKEKKKHHKHKHRDEDGKEKIKSRKELPPDSDLAGFDDIAVLENMVSLFDFKLAITTILLNGFY